MYKLQEDITTGLVIGIDYADEKSPIIAVRESALVRCGEEVLSSTISLMQLKDYEGNLIMAKNFNKKILACFINSNTCVVISDTQDYPNEPGSILDINFEEFVGEPESSPSNIEDMNLSKGVDVIAWNKDDSKCKTKLYAYHDIEGERVYLCKKKGVITLFRNCDITIEDSVDNLDLIMIECRPQVIWLKHRDGCIEQVNNISKDGKMDNLSAQQAYENKVLIYDEKSKEFKSFNKKEW